MAIFFCGEQGGFEFQFTLAICFADLISLLGGNKATIRDLAIRLEKASGVLEKKSAQEVP